MSCFGVERTNGIPIGQENSISLMSFPITLRSTISKLRSQFSTQAVSALISLNHRIFGTHCQSWLVAVGQSALPYKSTPSENCNSYNR